jgi:CheY-like chemotaxis protein
MSVRYRSLLRKGPKGITSRFARNVLQLEDIAEKSICSKGPSNVRFRTFILRPKERWRLRLLVRALAGGRRMAHAVPRRPVVLVVEDEYFLRINAILMIEDAGYDVLEAADADQAIEILEARPDVHVIFTDIQIPGSMDGLKLAHAVRGRWPPIKIIATSGHVNLRADDLPEGGRFLPKPYRPEEIVGTLRELVGA